MHSSVTLQSRSNRGHLFCHAGRSSMRHKTNPQIDRRPLRRPHLPGLETVRLTFCPGPLTFKDRSSDYVQICNSRSHIIQYGFVCGSVIPVKQRSINCQLAVNWQWKNGIVAVVTSTAGCQKRFWYAMGKQRSTLLRPS